LGLAGVDEARVLLGTHQVQVTYDPQKVSAPEIISAIRGAPAMGESGNYDAVLLTLAPEATPPNPTVAGPGSNQGSSSK
jgi:hypothetical protein